MESSWSPLRGNKSLPECLPLVVVAILLSPLNTGIGCYGLGRERISGIWHDDGLGRQEVELGPCCIPQVNVLLGVIVSPRLTVTLDVKYDGRPVRLAVLDDRVVCVHDHSSGFRISGFFLTRLLHQYHA